MVKTGRVLSIGLRPSAIDFSKYADLTEEILTARIEAGEATIRAAGIDLVPCQVPADPDEAGARVRAETGPFAVAMIGAGVRMAGEHTLLFERLVNVLIDAHPGLPLCFNTSPESTIDALRRWV
ncbi:hypothetical protein [Phytomonospora endophytica]|uniref:Uncharacterized protein n=1 Tax=Phytomonospora endophytica TaxID=714109 RepID=A0A841G278_9ACTN|nr:hypothetical protein [Phytomonospora endophytica]MBB6039872.1 hypothetical protein [Phytomonospora endophytica]GIG71058.1 hypothetical protein Pen01_73530 [Phytomonospora endophytica]